MFLNILQNRRSIRKFKNTPVSSKKLAAILEAALRSPSSRNLNPWEFIVITDKKKLADLSCSKPHGASFLKNAPLGIAVIANPERCDVWIEDTAIASILIQLAAEAEGLKSCWIQIRKRSFSEKQTAEEKVREILSIPNQYRVESIIAIGHPDEEKPGHLREKLLDEKIHHEVFQARKD